MGKALAGHPIDTGGTLESLRAELEGQRRLAEAKEHQLQRYAADLRDTFVAERERAEQLRNSYVATVRALTSAVEARDAYTAKHTERVAAYGLELTRLIDPEMAANPQIEFGFLLHDIGKVAIPDGVLHKATHLSDAEKSLMRRHPVIGFEIVHGTEFLEDAAQIVRHHHERWDGTGYPDRLAGEEIPLAARVFSVADTLDALTTDRPYRPASSWDDARAEIRRFSGSQFDPTVVDAFEQIPDEQFARLRGAL